MTLTLTDMFCGSGGSSTGAIAVPGVQVATAMNHWDLAIESHNANHQSTRHVLADISQTDPRYIPSSDILWASPECTNHSIAKGRKRVTAQSSLFDGSLPDEAADRSRATMWDVPRFAEHHNYRLIITENVVDAAKWLMFDAWLLAMTSLGYAHHIVYQSGMHFQLGGLPAPQSRDRMYVMFWKKGNRRPDFDRLRPKAWCPTCDEVVDAIQSWKKPDAPWGRYRAQYVWRCPRVSCRNRIVEPAWLPAASAIDWSIRGQRIGDRAKPLAEKTMRRIEAGLRRYAGSMHLEAAGNTYDSADPKRGGDYWRIWPVSEELRTLHGSASKALIVNHTSGADASRSTPVTDPMRTIVGGGMHQSLLIPVEGRDGKEAMPDSAPMRTMTTRNETAILIGLRGTSDAQIESSGYRPSESLRTVSAGGNHTGLAISRSIPSVEDCEFRMFEPHEYARGMAFPDKYIILGSKRDKVKQLGNAVVPPAARDLVTIGAASLEAA